MGDKHSRDILQQLLASNQELLIKNQELLKSIIPVFQQIAQMHEVKLTGAAMIFKVLEAKGIYTKDEVVALMQKEATNGRNEEKAEAVEGESSAGA